MVQAATYNDEEIKMGKKCLTEVTYLAANVHIISEVLIAAKTTDWTVLEGHDAASDSSNSTNCLPVPVPFIAKRCFKSAGDGCS